MVRHPNNLHISIIFLCFHWTSFYDNRLHIRRTHLKDIQAQVKFNKKRDPQKAHPTLTTFLYINLKHTCYFGKGYNVMNICHLSSMHIKNKKKPTTEYLVSQNILRIAMKCFFFYFSWFKTILKSWSKPNNTEIQLFLAKKINPYR